MADGTIMDFPKRSVIEWQAVAMLVVFFLWFYFVCSYYVVPAKTMGDDLQEAVTLGQTLH
jgi:hypothetical protein